MAEQDRQRWNERYGSASPVLDSPSPVLEELASELPRAGAALDLAGGRGRNALWLARRGLDTTLVDIAERGLEQAQAAAQAQGLQIRTVQQDLELEELPPGPWDLVLLFNYLQRDLFARLPAVLARGGLVLLAHPTLKNLERNPRPSARYLLGEGEALELLAELELVHCREGWTPGGRHEAQILARRPL